MKLAKKILVGIIVASILACCFALSSSAGAESVGSIEELSAAYEYVLPVHFYEDFQALIPAGETSLTVKRGTIKNTAIELGTSATGNNGLTEVIAEGTDGNVAVKVYYKGTAAETCKFYTKAAGFGTPADVVVTYKVMVVKQFDQEGNPIGGSKVEVRSNDEVMFVLDFSDPESPKYSYGKYDKVFTLVDAEGSAPAFDTWYSVECVFQYSTGTYSVNVLDAEGNSSFSIEGLSVGKYENTTDVRIVLADTVAEAVTWFDDVAFYEGTMVRDASDPNAKINAYVMQADAIASASDATVEDIAAVADFYNTLFSELGYEPVAGTANYDRVKEIYDGHIAFFNAAYTRVLQKYATALHEGSAGNYYERVNACEYIKDIDEYYPSIKSELLLLPGITDEIADMILDCKAKIASANKLNERIKQESDRFIALVSGFDFATNDYYEMYKLISALADCKNLDLEYKGAAEAYAQAVEIEALLVDIDANVDIFINAVSAMPDPSAPDFDVTAGFAATYENYLLAAYIYENGSLHENLNVLTHPEAQTILALMDKFDAISGPIKEQKDNCEAFITLVIQAKNASSFKYKAEAVAAAANYILTVLDDYAGVAEAKSDYNAMVAEIDAANAAAAEYMEAVAAINIEASYSVLKAAVNTAKALKASGAVIGIAGVQEANEAFAVAEAKIIALEGNSSTLISAVSALSEATSFSERRELITIAIAAKDGAEDTISGVTAAKSALETEISKLNSEISAVNAAFANAVSGAADVMAATAPTDTVYQSASVIKDFVN